MILVRNLKAALTAVGVGPGDPDLITMKGVKAIQSANLIFVPRSEDGKQSLALRIARAWIDPTHQQIIELALPMTRNTDRLRAAWRAAADQIAICLGRAQAETRDIGRGVYLLLGDPLLYGTFTYIWAELAERYTQIDIEIIPGITSFAASAARAKFVLSTSSDRVAILPASYETDAVQLRRLLADYDTVILMKVGPVFSQILAALEETNLLESTLYAERVGMPEERIAFGPELSRLGRQRRPYLSLLIVRKSTSAVYPVQPIEET